VDGIARWLFVRLAFSCLRREFLCDRQRGFLGPKYRLKTYLPEVAGLTSGRRCAWTEWKWETWNRSGCCADGGQALEKNKNIEVVMRVDKRYQSDI